MKPIWVLPALARASGLSPGWTGMRAGMGRAARAVAPAPLSRPPRGPPQPSGGRVLVVGAGSVVAAPAGHAEAFGEPVQDDGQQHHRQAAFKAQTDVQPL